MENNFGERLYFNLQKKCQAKCFAEPNCTVFSYLRHTTTYKKRCLLINGNDIGNDIQAGPLWVSGPKTSIN